MSNIHSNLKVILDERELSLRQVSRDINYRFESVRQFYHDENKTYPRELIAKLCAYLEVSPGDLLYFQDEKKSL